MLILFFLNQNTKKHKKIKKKKTNRSKVDKGIQCKTRRIRDQDKIKLIRKQAKVVQQESKIKSHCHVDKGSPSYTTRLTENKYGHI
jgi:hypothetical protein